VGGIKYKMNVGWVAYKSC